ncbi:EamA family transporter [Texcoconibacillus texcoconensis]|uniref:Drug/metabolite transporter (DMT)-like permease n=1 Tax=Texcoconibacillus texcoconensis TaxID=1095777 RepID=A0A840QLL8_9BACI|nr:drug/metabolite transporter (DMT)-like permease [Texcoconibacillus texcoconensis]
MARSLTYSLLILVMFIWGLNVVAVKYLVEHFPPVAMQGFRILVAGIVAIIVLYFLRDLRKLTKKEWGITILAALFGQLGHHALLAIGLVETTASNASLILGLIPITTSILAMIFFRDKMTWLQVTGIIFGFSGVAIVVLQNNGSIGAVSTGDFLVFTSMFSQALSFILIKMATKTLSSRQMTAVMLLLGSILLLGTSLVVEPNGFSQLTGGTALVWTVFFVSAILATGLGHILYNAAIQQIGAGETAIFNNLVPFFSLIGAFLFLGESIYVTQVIGFFLIVTGVLLGTGYVDSQIKKKKKNAMENAL